MPPGHTWTDMLREETPPGQRQPRPEAWTDWAVDVLVGLGAAAASTGVGWLCRRWGDLSLFIMVFLVGSVATAVWRGRLASAVASVLGMLSFDYFFESPAFDLTVADWRNFIVFSGFLAISQLVATLVHRLRLRTVEAVRKEREAAHLATIAELERTRSTLLSAVSHDFRTPLATIGAAASTLLEEAQAAPEWADLARLIVHESQRLDHLVNNLLDMTRLEAGGLRPSLEIQPLEEVVGTVLNRLEPITGPVAVDLPDELPPAPLDSVLMEQLLTNLLENAFRHGGRGQVQLRAEAGPSELLVEVADGGKGIPEGLRERVFEKFYRAPGSSADGGAGLGLAICKAIVQVHGGRIWVEEAPGGGAAFRFTLPLGGGAP